MNEQVLIVDDEQDTAELLRYNLQKENYRTIVATNGEEALRAVQDRAPDAVLLDIMMPRLNGWEVCRILRESAQGKSLPIIMLTALSDEESRIKGLSLGADDFVTKPFSVKELLLKVRKAIDRQQALKQFQAREAEQDTSLRYMVHELKNSLNVIGGYSSLGLRKGNAPNYLRTINTAAVHADSILNDASLLSRLERTGASLPVEPIDVAGTVKDVVEMFHDMAEQNKIEIIIMNSAPSPARGNRTAVRQLLVNLISNAVKYNRAGGKVWVSFDEQDGWIDISVRDEGNGIVPEELPRIFDKFFRASGSKGVTGSGLGLYIVKLLTEAMGGKIRALSNQGAGSTFTVSLQKHGAQVRVNAVHSENRFAQSA